MNKEQVSAVESQRLRISPFVKWAGGKSQLQVQFRRLYPAKFKRYYEPFLGGGAVFFHLYSTGRIKEAHLNDANHDLMNLWAAVKLRVVPLLAELDKLQKQTEDRELYNKNRNEFNAITLDKNFLSSPNVRKAALLLYLNKTCYNGLYRVNASGKFNVPFGKYRQPKLASRTNLKNLYRVLRDHERIHLTSVDFEKAVMSADANDFIYLDPPYQPLSSTSNFTGYTETGFDSKQQERLAKVFRALDTKGCLVMLSNSHSRVVLKPLYHAYFEAGTYTTVSAKRAISSVGSGRGAITELVIMNYSPKDAPQSKLGDFE